MMGHKSQSLPVASQYERDVVFLTVFSSAAKWALPMQGRKAEAERQRLLSAGFSANQTQEVTFRDVRIPPHAALCIGIALHV
jgi:hypothetical protein